MIWLRSAGQHDSKAKSIAKFPIIFANFKWVLITKFSLLQKIMLLFLNWKFWY